MGHEWRRGMAVPAGSANGAASGSDTTFMWKGQQYVIVLGEDYPYAADGLLIWKALQKWFHSYLSLYYKSDADIASDPELTAWYAHGLMYYFMVACLLHDASASSMQIDRNKCHFVCGCTMLLMMQDQCGKSEINLDASFACAMQSRSTVIGCKLNIAHLN